MQYLRARAAPALGSEPWTRLDTSLSWQDLVLPLSTLEPLRDVPALFSERFWTASPAEHGQAARRGVLLLFAGGAGTGKTSAAKVLGHELRLPVLETDLAQIFARGRIDATRLLARLFATAQRLTAVLVLEGAEIALSELSEGATGRAAPPPRIAATDIGELWRHCDSHPGIVIFPTTRPGDIPAAVRARFDAAIEFPFPEPPARHELWRRALPAGARVSEGDLGWLAGTFALPGGAIAATAARAQQAAQAEGRPVELDHIADALELEYASRPVKHAARAGLDELRRRRGAEAAVAPALVPLRSEPEVAEAAPAPEAVESVPEVPEAVESVPEVPEAVESVPEVPEAVAPAPEAPAPVPPPEPLAPPHEPPAPAPEAVEPPTTEIAALDHEPAAAAWAPAPHAIDDAAADRLVQTMAQAPPAPPARRRGAPLRLIPVALIGLVSAVALGLAAAKQRTPTTSTTTPASRTATTPQMTFSFPADWQIGAAPAVVGLPLSHALAVTSTSPAGRLIIGFGDPRDDRPLPTRFIAATLTGTPTPELVTLGSHRFYRVLDPRLSLAASSESVYALPSAPDPVIAVCQTSSQTFAASCEHVLATLQVTAGTPPTAPATPARPAGAAGPRPDAAYAVQLSRVLAALNTQRIAAARALADAPTLTDQERAAALLASLHGTAAQQVAALHVTGPSAAANTALAGSLRTLANAYGALAFALLYHETGAYPVAEARLAHANADVHAALMKLTALGYTLG